jgi:hypothetical protein
MEGREYWKPGGKSKRKSPRKIGVTGCAVLAKRSIGPAHICPYPEVLRCHQCQINQASRQRAAADIVAPAQSLAPRAVARAEMPKAIAIKNPKAEPIWARKRISWLPLSMATPEASNCPATDFHVAPMAAMNVINAIGMPSSHSIHDDQIWRGLAIERQRRVMRLYRNSRPLYALHPLTNSTRLRKAIPEGPLAIQGFCSSIQAVPAMSR